MDTGLPDHTSTPEGNADGTLITSPKVFRGNWTKQKWSIYLQKMRKEVETGEAPIELYLHGLEILGSQQAPEWVCLQGDPAVDQSPALSDQGGVSVGSTLPDSQKTYVACGFTNQWSTKEWAWLFGAAQDMQEHGPWLHHIAHHIAPKVTPSPTETKLWKREDRQRHQMTIKDIWGAHLRQVEHLITNANAPKLLLAITKDLYVDTMLQHGEGEPSSGSSSSQAPSTPSEYSEAVPIRGGIPIRANQEYQFRRGRFVLWSSEHGLQEFEKSSKRSGKVSRPTHHT